MLGRWVGMWALAAVGFACASRAHAQAIAVTETNGDGTAAVEALTDMIGPAARHVAPPADTSDPDRLLSWPLDADVAFAAIVALDVRRVFVVIPGERRTLERVLPADVVSTDAFAVALAASELLEIARWGEAGAARAAAPEPDASPTDASSDPVEHAERPDPSEAAAAPAAGLRVGVGLGLQGWVGAPRGLADLDARIAVDLGFVEVHWLGGVPFVEFALAGFGLATERLQVGGAPFRLTYGREEFGARAGLAFSFGSLELRPFGSVALDWVRIRATRFPTSAPPTRGGDDRAASTLGLGVEARIALRRRWFFAAAVSGESMLGRTGYRALGEEVLREPVLRFVGRLTLGISLPGR